MDTIRCVHFADLHLGVEAGGRPNPVSGLNQRIEDACDRLDELCAYVEAEGVHAVLFAGDAFKHQHPTPTLQRLFAERIRRLARSGAAVLLLIGNHDLPKMASLSHPFSIYDALEVEGVVVGDRARVYPLTLTGAPAPVLHVAALPHFSRHHVLAKLPNDVEDTDRYISELLAATVRGLASEVPAGVPAVLAGHCHVNQADVGPSQAMFGVSDVEVSLSTLASSHAFAYYALGHVHRHQIVSRDPFVAYSGSLERVDFGEGETVRVAADGSVRRRGGEAKGFIRFDLHDGPRGWTLAGEPVFESVDARRFVTIRTEAGEEDPTGEVVRHVETARRAGVELRDAFVKVVAELGAADRSRLRPEAVRAAVDDAYDVRVVVEATADLSRVRDPRFARRMTETEALERYLETQAEWEDDRDELFRAGRDLIEEVLS